jgi:sugar lactone lactonase YvrE
MKRSLVRHGAFRVYASALAMIASGCSGGGNPSPTSPSSALLDGAISLAIPPRSTPASSRHVDFISPLATSVTIAITGAPTVVADVSATSPNCAATTGGGRSCTIAIKAPHGTDTFTVTIYAGAGGTGAVLGIGTSTATVANASFTVPVGVDGVPASIAITAGTTTFTTGTAGTTPITVTAIDADGTTPITGTYANPVTLAITGNSAGFTLSTTTVTASGQTVTLAYNGSPGVRTIGISGTASGIAPSNVTPVAVSVAPLLNLYVINGASPNTLTVFPANASGNVAPSRTIAGANTQLGNLQGVAADGQGTSYVSMVGGAPRITEYASALNGNVAPTNTITGPDTQLGNVGGIALDGAGELFVANGETTISVYAAGAIGDAAPIRTISGLMPDPIGVAFDRAGNLYVVQDPGTQSPDSVAVYAPGATGNAVPIRTITGSNTGMSGAYFDAVDSSGRLYVANAFGNGSVTVYAAGANGNAAPIATIAGTNTGLFNAAPEGIAVDSNGLIYVTTAGGNAILVFAANANGNVAPLRTIAGANTGLIDPRAIAVGP